LKQKTRRIPSRFLFIYLCSFFGYFSFCERAAVPPAKLDVFECKRLFAYLDDFILLFV